MEMIALEITTLTQKPATDWLLIVLKLIQKIPYRSYNIKNKMLHNKFILKHFCLWCKEDILCVEKSTGPGFGSNL